MAESRAFYYETAIEWRKEKEGEIKGQGLPLIAVGAPPEFGGREGNWAPEHLFVASLNTCFMLTLLVIAENSKIPLVSFRSTAKGKLEKIGGAGHQITEVIIKPVVVIGSAKDLGRFPKILEKAKENCFISNSVKTVIKLEPELSHDESQTS
jgi:organic hydroperoxide reductase OsmC/OhrA